MIAGSSLFFLIHMKYIVFFLKNVDFKLTSEAKIQPVFTGREDMPVAFDFSHQGHARVGHALRPIVML